MTSFSSYNGPRLMRPDEQAAFNELSQLCFGSSEILGDELNRAVPPRRGGTYVLAHQGRMVAKIGIYHDQIRMYDALIPVAGIGGVCTHPDYRSKGLASHLLEFCTAKLTQEGAHLMLISGARGVYTRLGNVPLGQYHYFSTQIGQGSAWRPTPQDLIARRMTPADVSAVSRLYQTEAVHFIRPYSETVHALDNPQGNTYIHAEQWLVERAGEAAAYLFLGCPWGHEMEEGIRHVGEYAGSRLALVDALGPLMVSSGLREIHWQVPWQDVELRRMLEECGYNPRLIPLDDYTVRIVNFPGLLRDLRSFLQMRLDRKLRRGLRFEQSGPLLGGTGTDRYTILRGAERLDLDGAAMTRLVMGSAEGEEPLHLTGTLAEIIPVLFPLPSFLPGINYR